MSIAQTQFQRRARFEALDRQTAHQELLERRRLVADHWRRQTDTRREAYTEALLSIERFSTYGHTFERIPEALVQHRSILQGTEPGEALAECRQRYVESQPR
ncbi:hypothetical protein AB0F46_23560 [Streptomyces sp. NPDC026665]|uniref:hypothetical protein n=1 Tax=Streptomyces sp. NPDC026665 TaxID=3154798 RepID=UPI0034003C82